MIQQANLEHLDALSLLFDAYRVFYRKSSDVEASKTFLKDRIAKKESVIFIHKSVEEIDGFVQLYPIFSSTRMKRLWLLNDLYVSENSRGKQIGEALMRKAQEWATQTNSCGLMLETEKANVIGNKLYPKMGFELNDACNFYSWDV